MGILIFHRHKKMSEKCSLKELLEKSSEYEGRATVANFYRCEKDNGMFLRIRDIYLNEITKRFCGMHNINIPKVEVWL